MAAEPTLDTSYLTPVPRTPFYRDIEKTYLAGQEARRLTPEVLIPITMLAQGNDYEAIAEKLTLDRGEPLQARDIKNRLMLLRGVLRVDSNRKALEVLLDRGELSLDQLLPPDFDPSVFSKITDDRDQKIIKGILEGADYPALAFLMRTSEAGIADRVKVLKLTLGADNNFQIFVFGLGAKEARRDESNPDIFRPFVPRENQSREASDSLDSRELELFKLYAQGNTYEEVKEKLHYSIGEIKDMLKRIRQKTGSFSNIQVIQKVLESEQLDIEGLLPEGFDPRVFEGLDETEAKILKDIVKGEHDWKSAQNVGLSEGDFRKTVSGIREKIGARRNMHAGLLYYGALEIKRRDAVSRGEDPEKVSVFKIAS